MENTPQTRRAWMPGDMTADQRDALDMLLNGQCSFAFVIGWAKRNGMTEYAAYVRTF